MNRRDPGCLEALLNGKIEIRGINSDKQTDPVIFQFIDNSVSD